MAFAAKYGIAVVHDFAYGAIGFDGRKPVSFLEVDGAKDVGVEIYTFSKTYNMAGWRVAFAVGNERIIRALELLQDHLYVSLFGAIQEAAAAALLGPQDCVTELVALYEARRNAFIAALCEAGWEVQAPSGSFSPGFRCQKAYHPLSLPTCCLSGRMSPSPQASGSASTAKGMCASAS